MARSPSRSRSHSLSSWIAVGALALALGSVACKKKKDEPEATPPPPEPPAKVELPPAPPVPAPPLGLPDTPSPEDNPTTAEKVQLGEMLFFDKRLGGDGAHSCEYCHVPEQGWSDGKAVSTKVDGKDNSRHSPPLYNVAYAKEWYWDGRKPTLESQILAAWTGQLGGEPDKVATALAANPTYAALFQRAFGGPPTGDNIVQALAAFVRTIRSGNSPWDRYEAGDKTAVSEDAIKGFEVFTAKANCALCHAPPLYTDMLYHNVGIGFDLPEPDPGRGKVTNTPKETGAFKTPGLRSVGAHPPYFHDGKIQTLEEAVDYMLGGGIRDNNPNIDEKLKPVKLTDDERAQLLAFIQALAPDAAPYTRPKLP